MANPLFNAIMGGGMPRQQQAGQSATQQKGTAQNAPQAPQMTPQDAMSELRAHPAETYKQAGFNVPDEIANNPQATVMHLIQSGQVGGPMMQRIQPLLSRMMGRR